MGNRKIDTFFSNRGEPAHFGNFRAMSGPIGSGNTVIANSKSPTLKNLRRYDDKILAVEMEAGGLALYCHENPLGWMVVRGISDDTSHRKDDGHQADAARNAAVVLRELIPFLIR